MAIVLLSQCEKEETFIDASPSFLNALIQRGIDTNEDGKISLSEARAVRKLTITNELVSDLTGIHSFSNLDSLICQLNLLTEFDVSKNTGLSYLKCNGNPLTKLDVSGNAALTTLDCSYCNLTDLDVSMNPELLVLHCGGNQLTMLDVSANTVLHELYINDMPSLYKLCVDVRPFPLINVYVYSAGSPNVYYATDCSK
jgi:Leucine-rich repeat (LRR) protein